ncbi:uncharacterized protein K452DRAFT_351861 [Aplosporella prunicola CBS 121167]|uniref:NAD(P)-binding domain-containing protein n=1 Tax=Aplosporella prunicola CBS 121167 TaxID=1176127 RepID=A0A6A6B8Y0_9PEZI|nr:uncharacterized protein K452DRAFT_351861 [Aplosporella prunicola CBS 121167]KAF2140639.1 hypothetical protein K452DRAFT_351861 [Aplosporella prunicola CBS 121167]
MRIAIAGTSGLGQLIAHYIRQDTSHQLVFISRTPQPALVASGYQVQPVNYADPSTLAHALAGIDVVISTVSGTSQLALIKAAVSSGVRRFAPAEFEGCPSLRTANDPLDRGRASALAYIQHYKPYFEATTVFVCGVLYERFQQGGLAASCLGSSTGVAEEGDYMMNLRYMTAQVPAFGSANQLSHVCMTAAQDVGRLVVAALDMPSWPPELRMHGERLKVYDLITIARQTRRRDFYTEPAIESTQTLKYQEAVASTEVEKLRLQNLIATAEGQHDFSDPNLNQYFPQIRMIKFQDWLAANWVNVL